MDQEPILGRYRPLRDLGEGGHGSVILAFDPKMARRVAIKRIPVSRNREKVTASFAEARTTALLNHPNVVTVYEWEATGREALLIMEYLDGVNLGEIVDGSGPLDADQAAAVFAAAADAIAYAHENGVLHLDLKPENVIVTRDGDVKVADFGIAALTDVTGKGRTSSGTLGFMPPEQLAGADLDEQADLWTLAALTYYMLTGESPTASARNTAEIELAVAGLEGPSELYSDLPEAVDDVLIAALDPNPVQRYQGVDRLADALLPLLGDVDDGALSLAELVESVLEPCDTDDLTVSGMRAGLARAGRLVAALLTGWLAWAGLSVFGLGAAPTLGAAALVSLATLGAPALGLALALLVLSIGILTLDAIAGIGFLVAAAGLWFFLGRHGELDSFIPAAAPLLAIGPFGLAAPIVAGLSAAPLHAAASSALASIAAMCTAAAFGAGPPFLDVSPRIVVEPLTAASPIDVAGLLSSGIGPVVATAGWVGVSTLVSLLSSRETRTARSLAALLGFIGLVGAYGLWTSVDASVSLVDGPIIKHLLGSSILVAAFVILGASPEAAPETRPAETEESLP